MSGPQDRQPVCSHVYVLHQLAHEGGGGGGGTCVCRATAGLCGGGSWRTVAVSADAGGLGNSPPHSPHVFGQLSRKANEFSHFHSHLGVTLGLHQPQLSLSRHFVAMGPGSVPLCHGDRRAVLAVQ